MINTEEKTGLKRVLKARHLSMIAIGGSIGTGLFVASGATIAQAGPGGAVISYLFIGIMVFFLMTSLGELAAYMPTSGSFSTYGAKYVEEGFGFALGWNYWYNWAITIAVDLVAAQLVMQYWLPDVPSWIWSAIFLAILFSINVISTKNFGEMEFWFSLIKVITVVLFIVVGLLMIVGLLKGAGHVHENWTSNGAPFAGGFASLIGVAMIVGFSFQGTELIGIAAGESENPQKNIPKAAKQIFWRILLFYVFAILVIGSIIPYTDSRLLNEDLQHISISPFTLIFENAGMLSAAAVMNAVILTSVLSAGNSGMYASTRMLFSLARDGKAPSLFGKLTKGGVPRNALIATTIMAALCFLTSLFPNQQIYLWLLNTSGMTGFIAWLGIAISHYRFRKGFLKQGNSLKTLPYRARFFPFGPFFAFFVCLLITLGQNYQAFLNDKIDWVGVTATYIGLPLFLVIWFGYKWTQKTKFVKYSQMKFGETPSKTE